jgi:hypothetical protein
MWRGGGHELRGPLYIAWTHAGMHPALAPVGDGVGRPRRLRLLGYPIRSDLSIGGARVVTVMRT